MQTGEFGDRKSDEERRSTAYGYHDRFEYVARKKLS
jgi:hypothetical protein